jgi:hypothetical protein
MRIKYACSREFEKQVDHLSRLPTIRRITMPQAIVAQVVMQVVQKIVEMLMQKISEALKQGQSQGQMQQTAQQTMEDNGIGSRKEQMDTLDQCEQESFNLGDYILAKVFGEMKSNWTGGAC